MATVFTLREDNADSDIQSFLEQEQAKDILRISTAGSVDDGKSTLIGRLLYDSRNVYEDHVRSVTRHDVSLGTSVVDFAQLTDGLRAEREQGITIDVAYRYFSTAKRKFIIADTPGHEQYTRNMATGASTSDLAIVLIDARKGVLVQSRRHLYIAALLGIPRVVATINKMDLVDFSPEVFAAHSLELKRLGDGLGIPSLVTIPISALDGDNVVETSARTPWYDGPSLLQFLETVPVENASEVAFRLPVQRVLRPHQEYRGFAGQIAAGAVRPGDQVVVLPSGRSSRVRSITTFDGDLPSAEAPLSIALTLEDEVDVSRGDVIAAADAPPTVAKRFEASLVWMDSAEFRPAKRYLLKHTAQVVPTTAITIKNRVNVQTFETEQSFVLHMNDIAIVEIETKRPLVGDSYRDNRTTGSFILIDPETNSTVAAGMIRSFVVNPSLSKHHVPIVELRKGAVVDAVEQKLFDRGYLVVRTKLDPDRLLQRLHLPRLVLLLEGPDVHYSRIRSFSRQTRLSVEYRVETSATPDSIVEKIVALLTEEKIAHE
ncbi:sulfate adenylyltransferase subunit 1 [Candidatus Koribacter versatilis Ellin345]|uniref:sulfate adenylyltransferase n=1 Tax=Koribacter versatilis (strain Ellin345) TaxID=204669 RepID=Q1ITG6_KORVE|nr:GTP-binding protein [Candidatus Koribacter versatilis]ABF39834.1 sulfate adenylyltransferase subunit 1 [Candidatus Koribacter versatilis Ellin345]